MESRVEMYLEDFEGLLDLHTEYSDSIDPGNIDARVVWDEIEHSLKLLSKRTERLRRQTIVSEDDMDELESMLEDLNEQYGELAALL